MERLNGAAGKKSKEGKGIRKEHTREVIVKEGNNLTEHSVQGSQ